MDDDDEWDLQAVVRSCNTISADAATAYGTNPTAAVDDDDDDDDYDVMVSVPSSNEMEPFLYSKAVDIPQEGLEEVYKEGCSQRLTATTTTTTTIEPDSIGDEPLHEMLNACDSISTETPSRKRKNQQKKMVLELSQQELCSDIWAWRKYGQKPIKGSPFPRNYYKCSTTKACGARKQVEQSHMDPTIFIVSYSGEHIHPPPTHRSPLAGSTRSTKFVMPTIPTIADDTSHSCTLGGAGVDNDDEI